MKPPQPCGATHVVTLCSEHRSTHVRRQIAALAQWEPEVVHHTVMIGRHPFDLSGTHLVDATGHGTVNLAAARNLAGDAAVQAGAQLVIFLDADCIPGPDLVSHYQQAAAAEAHSVLCGPVTYLPQDVALPSAEALANSQAWPELIDWTAPHQARPNPQAGVLQPATPQEYTLFWSLSFAVTTPVWRRLRSDFGGFCEAFTGYGGEDTDFAMNLRRTAVPMTWVGGAHAYHQWHPVSSPPVEHLEDILTNAQIFHKRWGWWPMTGWLDAFEHLGLVRFTGDSWERLPGVTEGTHV